MKMKSARSQQKSRSAAHTTLNRRAAYDYHLGDQLTAGLVLSGPEVRQVRDHHVQLKSSFITLKNGELWLNNLTLGADTAKNIKLLVTKKQLATLARAKVDGHQIVPVKLLGAGRYIKLVLATGTSKKKYDKRLTIKHRDLDREGRR